MLERIGIPFTNEHFIAWCEKMIGQPYWYGTTVNKCSEALLTRKTKQYPSHYTSGRTSRYKDDIAKKKVCADCVGACKGYSWANGGENVLEAIGTDKNFTNKYGSNGCPDKSANGMFSYAKSQGMDWGTIDTIPEIVGLAVRFDGHVGYYAGNGEVIEWRGFAYGCVRTKLSGRKWTHWYKLPFIDYGDAAATDPKEVTLGSRLLKKGMTGSDVKMLQELLLQLGYALPKYGADGDFGAETEAAVKEFQKAVGLEHDGEYGELTHAALMDAVADADANKPDETPAPDDAEPGDTSDPEQLEEPQPVGETIVITANEGGRVNIRKGNGTEYGRITTVDAGTTYAYVATASNGWNAIVISGQVGWVSGKYSKIV